MESVHEHQLEAAREDDIGAEANGTIRGVVHEMGAAVKQSALEAAAAGMGDGANRISRLARAVHGAADEIGGEVPPIADYVHAAADRLEGAASTLRQQNIENVFAAMRRLVRREPALVFAGLLLAGLLVSALREKPSMRQ